MDRTILERKVKRKILKEFRKFRKITLLYATKPDIWQSANKISFMESARDYFEYNELIPEPYLKLALVEPALLQLMWQEYLKDSYADYMTWDGLDAILETVLLKWKAQKCA